MAEKPLVTVDESGNYMLNESIREGLTSNPYFEELIQDVIHSAKAKSKQYECNRPLTLYEKYSRKDACKLLNWNADESSTMYGYKPKHNTCPDLHYLS